MKKTDVAEKLAHEQEDWRKNGIGGLVHAVDLASNTITVVVTAAAGAKDLTIRATKGTVVRRYAPDSVQFDKATLSSLDQIKPGDQLRARGSRSAGEGEFVADEIVTGSFRNIAGTVSSVDATTSSIQVDDLLSKKSIRIKITQESQVRKLTPPMAQRIAQRLKGTTPGENPARDDSRPNTPPENNSRTNVAAGVAQPRAGGARSGGAPDLQQMILRMPPSPLADFQKGDAVMVVATETSSAAQATAIILLGGVEPILASTSKAEAGNLLSPWSLSTGGGGADAP
jgi:hypothetical protein